MRLLQSDSRNMQPGFYWFSGNLLFTDFKRFYIAILYSAQKQKIQQIKIVKMCRMSRESDCICRNVDFQNLILNASTMKINEIFLK